MATRAAICKAAELVEDLTVFVAAILPAKRRAGLEVPGCCHLAAALDSSSEAVLGNPLALPLDQPWLIAIAHQEDEETFSTAVEWWLVPPVMQRWIWGNWTPGIKVALASGLATLNASQHTLASAKHWLQTRISTSALLSPLRVRVISRGQAYGLEAAMPLSLLRRIGVPVPDVKAKFN